jgi:TRAP-type C4-dicarboxylate transport system permease small subunit
MKQNSVLNAFGKMANSMIIPSAVFLLGMMLLIVFRIIFRFIGIPLRGSYEVIDVTAILVTTFTIIYAVSVGSTIAVDLIIARLNLKGKLALRIISDVVSIVFWGFLSYASVYYTLTIAYGAATLDLGIPYTPFKIVWAIGLIIYCLAIVKDIFDVINDKEGKWTQS